MHSNLFLQSLKDQKSFRVMLGTKWEGFECVFVLTASCDKVVVKVEYAGRYISGVSEKPSPIFTWLSDLFSMFPLSPSSHYSYLKRTLLVAALTQIHCYLQPSDTRPQICPRTGSCLLSFCSVHAIGHLNVSFYCLSGCLCEHKGLRSPNS